MYNVVKGNEKSGATFFQFRLAAAGAGAGDATYRLCGPHDIRVAYEAVLVLFHLEHLTCLELGCAIVVNDANASTQLKKARVN